MNRNSLRNTNPAPRNGLRVARIINEQWPEVWQAAIDRQERQLEHRRALILAARGQLRRKFS